MTTTKIEIWTLVEVNSGIIAHPKNFLNEVMAEKAYIDRANELYPSSSRNDDGLLEKFGMNREDDVFTTKIEADEYQSLFEVKDDLRLFYNKIMVVSSGTPMLDAIDVDIMYPIIPQK